MEQRYAIGVDLGGTTVKTGLISESGEIVFQTKLPTLAEQNPEAIISQIKKTIHDALQAARGKHLAGIGIASAGIIENPGGIVKSPPNFKGWESIPLGKEMEKEFGMDVVVDNDANAAAVAESKFGAGKEYPNFLFVIWGTGVGGGIILNNHIYRGQFGGAGEVGHISIDYKGLQCNCGSIGCVEAYVGQKYLSKRTIEKLQHHPESSLHKIVGGNLSALEPIHLSQAAEAGDEFSRNVLLEAGQLLGVAIASVMNMLDLRVTVIGGGVSAVGDFVYNEIIATTKKYVLTPLRPGITVLRAKLGNDAGMLGAAGLVL
ncbi:MAG: ROK family protein [Bacteroidetes bacterium]|nr:ROK family protein [Bacteroidota bacterium]